MKKDNIKMYSYVMSCEAGKRMDEAKNLVQSLSFGTVLAKLNLRVLLTEYIQLTDFHLKT